MREGFSCGSGSGLRGWGDAGVEFSGEFFEGGEVVEVEDREICEVGVGTEIGDDAGSHEGMGAKVEEEVVGAGDGGRGEEFLPGGGEGGFIGGVWGTSCVWGGVWAVVRGEVLRGGEGFA